jgi:hemoglobin
MVIGVVVSKHDLDSKEQIRQFIERFYARMLKDEQLAPIFLDVAEIELDQHLPLICAYWEKLLLGERAYQRHTMNIHRALHSKRALTEDDFKRWLALFCATLDAGFAGPKADRAKQVALHIARNMQQSVSGQPSTLVLP